MRRSQAEAAAILRAFLAGAGSAYDWDDFISIRISDPHLDAVRERCAGLPEEFPTESAQEYCSEAGLDVIREYVAELERAVEQQDAADGAGKMERRS
jgi:hypothetical protein